MRRPVDVWIVTSIGATARDAGESPTVPVSAMPGGARTPAARSTAPPERCPELAHMSLDRLRAYRQTLQAEELRASYWRRILQARRDVLRADSGPGDRESLRDALTEIRAGNGRQAILSLHPEGGMPILPNLPELWARSADVLDDHERAELNARLASAESVLSSYREALHRRLDRATADLVARYHEDPRQCLVALPLDR